TTIEYKIPESGLVTIKVYDILGREVQTLVDQQLQPGFYSVQFDGSNLASGIYFYRIKAGKFVQTKKLMLLK
ncbi:T9SS type A sorting domain-containing protein, partial [bacterium BMS3Abin03]|nr:T9SS type A sorting domain-containing protein [bacterium BMS3Abin03]